MSTGVLSAAAGADFAASVAPEVGVAAAVFPGLLYPGNASSGRGSTGFPRRSVGRPLAVAPLSDAGTFGRSSALVSFCLESEGWELAGAFGALEPDAG
jgi:hypothetical protein